MSSTQSFKDVELSLDGRGILYQNYLKNPRYVDPKNNDLWSLQAMVQRQDPTFFDTTSPNNVITSFSHTITLEVPKVREQLDFIPKYMVWKSSIPNVVLTTGSYAYLGALSACPIKQIVLRFGFTTVATLTKQEIYTFNSLMPKAVSDVLNLSFTPNDDITANPSSSDILIPIPTTEAFDYVNVGTEKYYLDITIEDIGNYVDTDEPTFAAGTFANHEYGIALLGICATQPQTSHRYKNVNGTVNNVYYKWKYLYPQSFSTVALQTSAKTEFTSSSTNYAAGIFILLSQNAPSSHNFQEPEINVISKVSLIRNSALVFSMEAPKSPFKIHAWSDTMRKLYNLNPDTKLDGYFFIDLSNLTISDVEDNNILPQCVINLQDTILVVEYSDLTPSTTYYESVIIYSPHVLATTYNKGTITTTHESQFTGTMIVYN